MPQTLTAVGLTTGRAPFVEEARNRGELYIQQVYELYSEENHEAWRQLYRRIQPRWERYANDHFLHGIEALALARASHQVFCLLFRGRFPGCILVLRGHQNFAQEDTFLSNEVGIRSD